MGRPTKNQLRITHAFQADSGASVSDLHVETNEEKMCIVVVFAHKRYISDSDRTK